MTQRELEEEICMMEQSLEYAETHGMYNAAAKIDVRLHEMNERLNSKVLQEA